MIFYLSAFLTPLFPALNVLHYVSVRAIASLLTALGLSFIFGPAFIRWSTGWARTEARESTPEHHREKDGMPTMGGLFVLAVVLGTSLLWADFLRPQIWVFLSCLCGFGLIGAWDDWSKIVYGRGISAVGKFIFQLCVAGFVTLAWLTYGHAATTVSIPFFKNLNPDLGTLFIPWAMLVIIATSNGVNLMDGLDGLAIGSLISNFATFSIICYLAGHYLFAVYLHIPFAASAELTVMGMTLVGASLGFLWYNSYPAQIFMGDVGSLALGAGLGLMALMCKQELILPISGGLFALETLSVIGQVLSFRLRGKRLFKMAPIHHHFELLGWPESKITVRFGIISLILCLFALMTLKLR